MAKAQIQKVPLELLIAAEEFNTRKTLGDLTDLVSSIRARGIDTPLLGKARENGSDEVELHAGFRRLAAAREVGLTMVPVRVWPRRSMTKVQMLIANVVENVQREDLNPVDEALALKRLQEEHEMSTEMISAQVGIKKSRVQKRFRLLKLEPLVRDAVHDGRISVKSAFEVDRLPKEKQPKYVVLAEELVGEKLSTLVDAELARLQKNLDGDKKKPKEVKPADVTEHVRLIKKASSVMCNGLGYDSEKTDAVKSVDYRVLEPDDLKVVAKLFDDCADVVEEDVDVNEKAAEAIVQAVEGAAEAAGSILNTESPEVRQILIRGITKAAIEIAQEQASQTGKRPRVTFLIAKDLISKIYAKPE